MARKGRPKKAQPKRRQSTREAQGRHELIGMTREGLVKKSMALGFETTIFPWAYTAAPNAELSGIVFLDPHPYEPGERLDNCFISSEVTSHDDGSSALAVLARNGLLDVRDARGDLIYEPNDLVDVGLRFWRLYWRALGSPHPRAARLPIVQDKAHEDGDVQPEPMSDDDAERVFKRQDDMLKSLGRDVEREVKRVCVDDMLPGWVGPITARHGTAHDRIRQALLIKGLCALFDRG